MNENYFSLKEKLDTAYRQTSASNFREVKQQLIELRKLFHKAELNYDERKELNSLFNQCFDKVNSLFEEEKEEFEKAAFENQQRLTPKVEEALINAKYAEDEDLSDAWNFCIEVQKEFKGIKLVKEVRESLYSQLQEAFDELKSKREKSNEEKEKASISIKEDILPQIEKLVSLAESAENMSDVWDKLINVQQQVKEADLSFGVRRELMDKIQDGFTILKLRKEEHRTEFEADAKENVESVESMIEKGEEMAANSESFKEVFEYLKSVQHAFKEHKLLQEDREKLYRRLQDAFETIKIRQDEYFTRKNQESIQNYNRLKPMVLKAFERAQTSMEFKKTREHLKRVQAEFKGIKMKPEDREELYSKLQSAFDIIGKRQDEYYAAKKDKIELHINYQISDIDLKIEALKDEIDKDFESINTLSETDSNPLIKDDTVKPSDDINNQIQILKASALRKEKEIEELLNMKESLSIKKNKWENID